MQQNLRTTGHTAPILEWNSLLQNFRRPLENRDRQITLTHKNQTHSKEGRTLQVQKISGQADRLPRPLQKMSKLQPV